MNAIIAQEAAFLSGMYRVRKDERARFGFYSK